MSAVRCAACDDGALRTIVDALAMDDLDRAITLGLLDTGPEDLAGDCDVCSARMGILIATRDERLRALAARDRFRARQNRLAERAAIRARKREATAQQASVVAPPLPPAAAAALARAKARVTAKRPPE